MRRLLIFLFLTLPLLSGCNLSPLEMPDGLSWRAKILLEDDLLLASAEDCHTRQGVPVLDVTAQVEGENIILTDHASGETYTGTLTWSGASDPNATVYLLAFPGYPEGYAVYGAAEQMDGSRDATLYLIVDGRTLYLTAPLPAD